MDARTFKDAVYSEISGIVKAFSNSNRLEIIDFLSNGEQCVEAIALETGISIANTSQHLQTLKKERIVSAKKIGVQVVYSLASKEVYFVWKALRDLSLDLSFELKELMKDQEKLPSKLSMDDIAQRDDIVLVDLRPKEEYQQAHFDQALSIPSMELEERMKDLPKDKLIITYCRGMFCSIADQAVSLLKSKGYRAQKIVDHPLDQLKEDN